MEALKNTVYEACLPYCNSDPRFVFTQSFIADLEVIPNDSEALFLSVLQGLVNDKLFKVVHDTERLAWRLRSSEDARK